jgi:hypothetical protein
LSTGIGIGIGIAVEGACRTSTSDMIRSVFAKVSATI